VHAYSLCLCEQRNVRTADASLASTAFVVHLAKQFLAHAASFAMPAYRETELRKPLLRSKVPEPESVRAQTTKDGMSVDCSAPEALANSGCNCDSRSESMDK
jgi:hypothetical protein